MQLLVMDIARLTQANPLLDRSWAVVVVMPATDLPAAERAAALMASRAQVKDSLLLVIHDSVREGFVSVVNQAFSRTQSLYFSYVAQDAFPGRQWLARGVNALMAQGKSMLGFNDGKWMGALASFGLARRLWAEKNYGGAFFFPGYHSHYGDVELTLLALNAQQYCYDPNAVLVEVDWGKDGMAASPEDKECFQERRRIGFAGKVDRTELLNMFG